MVWSCHAPLLFLFFLLCTPENWNVLAVNELKTRHTNYVKCTTGMFSCGCYTIQRVTLAIGIQFGGLAVGPLQTEFCQKCFHMHINSI